MLHVIIIANGDLKLTKDQVQVSIFCIAFNHEKYIRQCLDGFLMQKEVTFEIIIHDDASTDKTADIIREYAEKYPDIFKPVYQTKNHKYAPHINYGTEYMVPLITGKYVAMCEGDDYWIHPLKLQSQVDFMERHSGHSACIHAYRKDVLDEEKLIESVDIHKYPEDKEIIPDEDVLNIKGMFNATASIVYRGEVLLHYPNWARKAPIGDRPLKLVLFSTGHIGYINEIMSVYRVGTKGSWTLRMRNDCDYRIKNIKGKLQLAIDFDNFTCKKYHKILKNEIRFHRVNLLKEYVKKYLHFSHVFE